MKRLILVTIMLISGLMITPWMAEAVVPQSIPYQGQLKDAAGAPVNGAVNITFNLYTVASGGAPIWTEVHTGVNISRGLFNIQLGSVPFPVGAFSSPVYLGVAVGTDPEMSPRTALGSAPYALHADDADTVGGFTSTQLQGATGATGPTGATGSAGSPDTAAQVKAKLVTVDGAGSGVDADLLDGQHGAAFATAAQYTTLLATVTALQNTVTAQQTTITTLTNKLQYLTVNGTDMTITGANLHIVSGSGTTTGVVNGLGNLIVGYNESRGPGDIRTGSHNIVVGKMHNYSSYGGLVVGWLNNITAPFASVSGGFGNTASGPSASVSGGKTNTASGAQASVSGGTLNNAFANYSAILGGLFNLSGDGNCVFNATNSRYECTPGVNHAIGLYSTISAGNGNRTAGINASVSGGRFNIASGAQTSVSGGLNNTASGTNASVSGGALNNAFAIHSAILGGLFNLSGDGNCAWIAANARYECTPGVNHNIGRFSTISAGNGNRAADIYASVSGGLNNTASGTGASVSGGFSNIASGARALVSGGYLNSASGTDASVSGGASNIASGARALVSGGLNHTAAGIYDWRAGTLFQNQ